MGVHEYPQPRMSSHGQEQINSILVRCQIFIVTGAWFFEGACFPCHSGNSWIRDERHAAGSQERENQRKIGLSKRILQAQSYNQDWQTGIASSSRQGWQIFDFNFWTLSAKRKGTLLQLWLKCTFKAYHTRKVKAITEELCGHEFSASSISAIVKTPWWATTWICGTPSWRSFSISGVGCKVWKEFGRAEQ